MPRLARPFVLINIAMSADGKIATANRAVSSFGSPADHNHLYQLRSTADAVLCGARTVNEPGITLGAGPDRFVRARVRQGLNPQPLRVVVSGRARLRPDADVFREPGGPIVVLVAEASPRRAVAALARVASEVHACGCKEVDLPRALAWLARERGVRRLVCEGGGELNDAMFRAGLVDELHVTLCPWLVGGRDAPTLAEGRGVARLADATRLELTRARRLGRELFLVYRVLPRPRSDVARP